MTSAVPAAGGPDRPCLAPLLTLAPVARLAAVHERLQELGRACAALEAEGTRDRARRREREVALRAHRYQMACLALHLEEEGLLARTGLSTSEEVLAAWTRAEGEGPLTNVQMRKYLDLGRFLPEDVAVSGETSLNVLHLVARTEDRACVGMLCGLLRSGVRRAEVRAAAEAAIRARRAGRPEEALAWARAARAGAGEGEARGGARAGGACERAGGADPALVERLKGAMDGLLRAARAAALDGPEVAAAVALAEELRGRGGTQERRRQPRAEAESGGGGEAGAAAAPAVREAAAAPAELHAAAAAAREAPAAAAPGAAAPSAAPAAAEVPGAAAPSAAPAAAEVPGAAAPSAAPAAAEAPSAARVAAEAPSAARVAAEAPATAEAPAAAPPIAAPAAAEALAAAPPIASPAPPAVPRRAPHEEVLAVPYPAGDDQPTEAERHGCALIRALLSACALGAPIRAVFDTCDEAREIDGRLQLHVTRALDAFAGPREELLAQIAARAAEGRAWLEGALAERRAAGEAAQLEDLLPLPADAAAKVPRPLCYLLVEVLDPLGDQPETATRRRCHRLLGLLDCARRAVSELQRRRAAGDAMSVTLLYQVEEVLRASRGHLGMVAATFGPAARAAEEGERAQRGQEEARREEAEARLVVLGEDRVPAQWTKLGHLQDGRPVAMTGATAQVVIAAGPQGCGKTQVGVLLSEGCHLALPGLTRHERPGRSVVLVVDYNRGQGRHQHLCGLHPNPYAGQWRYLRERFPIGFPPHRAAFPRMKVLCLPGTAERYRAQYAAECERGLTFQEIGFHPSEQGSLFYRLLLPAGSEGAGQGRHRSQWRAALDSMIGNLGEGSDPDRLFAEFQRAKLPGANLEAVRAQVQLIKALTRREGRLIDALREPEPVVVLLESAHLGPQRLLPLEVAIMHALSAPLPSSTEDGDDPLRWFILHEVGKQGGAEVVAEYLKEVTAELRHRRCSYFLESQLISSLPPDVVTLATGVLQFKGTSQGDYRRLQELYAEFRGVPFAQVAAQGRGMAYGAFRRATDPGLTAGAQPLLIRPSAIWAGGETLSVAGG